MKKEYSDKQQIIYKLIRKGLKPKPNNRNVEYFEKFENNTQIGIKSLGMIDFLGCKIKTLEAIPRTNKKKEFKKFHKSCCICKGTATLNRYYEGEWYNLCETPLCLRRWRDTIIKN